MQQKGVSELQVYPGALLSIGRFIWDPSLELENIPLPSLLSPEVASIFSPLSFWSAGR